MRKGIRALSLGILLAGSARGAAPATRHHFQSALRQMPLVFHPNVGETDARVRFYAFGRGYTVFLTNRGAVISLFRTRRMPIMKRDRSHGAIDAVRLTLLHSAPSAKIVGLRKLAGKANIFFGDNPRKWRTRVPTFEKVKYQNIYPDIDLVFYGHNGRLEFDFVVRPGGNPNMIALGIENLNGGKRASSIALNKRGDLVIQTSDGKVRFDKPSVYQTFDVFGSDSQHAPNIVSQGRGPSSHRPSPIHYRQLVEGHYVLAPENHVHFAISHYDRRRTLVIDPMLAFSTYLGGSDMDWGTVIAVDGAGNIYVAGYTASLDFPVAGGFETRNNAGTCTTATGSVPCFDAFVTELNPAGAAIIASTYLGGVGDTRAMGIAVDAAGEAYVTGYTNAANFPVRNAFESSPEGSGCQDANPCYDAFVTKLAPGGANLIYSTLLGGSSDDYGMAIAADTSGNAYVAGITDSIDFPATSAAFETSYNGGAYDGFVAKFGPTGGSPIYATYLGGNDEDEANAIAVDASGDAYVTGQTKSQNFPVANAFEANASGGLCGCFNAFVTELDPTGAGLIYSTYLGGTGGDYGNGIAVDASGDAFVTGWTASSDFPVTSGAFDTHYSGTYDAFVSKVGAGGTNLVYSTYLGGINPTQANAIALDSAGNAYLTGWTYGVGFPVAQPIQTAVGKFYNAFIAELNSTGSALTYSTELGGSGDDFGESIAVDASGDADITGATFSLDFPITPGAFQPVYGGGGYDAFVLQVSPANQPALAVVPGAINFTAQAVGTTSPSTPVKLMNAGAATIEIKSVSATGDFTITSNNCPGSIPPDGLCTLEVAFSPTAEGSRAGEIDITDNAPNDPQTISLTGTGAGDFTLTAANSTATVLRGADSLTFAILAQTSDGFTGNITLACPSGIECSFSPPAIAPGESSTLTVSGLSGVTGNDMTFNVTGSDDAQSATVPLEIEFLDFALSVAPSAATISGSGSASYALAIAPVNGFSQPVALACAGAPPALNCQISPSAVTLSATGASATVEVATSSGSSAIPLDGGARSWYQAVVTYLIAILLVSWLCSRLFGLHQPLARAAALALLMGVLASCGGKGVSPAPNPGMPHGTYTLTLTGSSGSLQHSATVTLTVN